VLFVTGSLDIIDNASAIIVNEAGECDATADLMELLT